MALEHAALIIYSLLKRLADAYLTRKCHNPQAEEIFDQWEAYAYNKVFSLTVRPDSAENEDL